MKKLFSLLLVVALVAIMATGAYASDASSYVSVSNSAPAIGENITVNVGISNNPGFCTGTLTISYDSSVLKLVSLENGMFQGVADASTGVVNHASINEVEGDGTLATATFEVIGSGEATISASIVDVTDYDFAPVGVSDSYVSISVAEPEAPHEHDYVQKSNASGHWTECECGDKTAVEDHVCTNWTETPADYPCTTGSKAGVCDVCGYEMSETIPAAEKHTWGAWTYADKDIHTRTCGVCGADDFEEHDYQERTSNTEGWVDVVCSGCGHIATSYEVEEEEEVVYDPTLSPKTGDEVYVIIAALVLCIGVVAVIPKKRKN